MQAIIHISIFFLAIFSGFGQERRASEKWSLAHCIAYATKNSIANGNDIMLQFLAEAIIISITGGIIGVALGLGLTVGVGSLLGWPVSVTVFSIAISFAVCAVTGIFFGRYPARKAAALDPIVALRYE